MSVYCFFYGLSSLVMGLTVLLRGRSSSKLALGRQFYWLGAFGLAGAAYGWAHMFRAATLEKPIQDAASTIYLVALPLAGILLIRFGIGLLAEAGPIPVWLHLAPAVLLIPGALVIAYGVVLLMTTHTPESLDQWTRYLLLLPGNLLAALAFGFQWRRLEQANHSNRNHVVLVAGMAFVVHTFSTSILLPTGSLPSSPSVEFWRTASMVLVALFVIRAMRVFEYEHKQEIDQLQTERHEARQMALTIYTRTRQETEVWLNGLITLGRQIANMNDADSVLIEVVSMARRIVKADVAMLALFEDTQKLVPKYLSIPDETTHYPALPLENPQILSAANAGTPLRLPEDMPSAELCWPVGDKEFTVNKAAIVPLRLNQTTIGVLCVGRYEGESFTCSALIGLGNLADQAVIALEHAMMTARLQSLAVTEERSRIAREMHDGLAQLLGYLGLQIQTLEALVKQGDSEAVLQELKQSRGMIKSAQADVRENILSLRTTLAGEATLSEALQAYVEEFGIQAGVITQFVNDTSPTFCLSPLAETQCVRIVQEALTNVRKHAHAEHVWVDMTEQAGYLSIVIADDGVGLTGGTVARRHFGLQTMHERAQSVQGSFVIESAPGQGTRVKLNLPLMS